VAHATGGDGDRGDRPRRLRLRPSRLRAEERLMKRRHLRVVALVPAHDEEERSAHAQKA